METDITLKRFVKEWVRHFYPGTDQDFAEKILNVSYSTFNKRMAKGYKIGEPDIIKILSRLEGKIKPMEMDLLREKLNITGSYIQSHSSGASMNIGTNHEEIAQLKEENARLKGMLEVYKEQLAQKDKQIQELLYKDKREP